MSEYQEYQLRWMIDKGFSLQNLIDELTRYQQDDLKDFGRLATPVSELFEEWSRESGFGSEIWACEDEWRDCEGSERIRIYENEIELKMS